MNAAPADPLEGRGEGRRGMSPAEERRIAEAAKLAAMRLPPMTDAAAAAIASIVVQAEREAQERQNAAARAGAVKDGGA